VCDEDGTCATVREYCPEGTTCSGIPAECKLPPRQIQAIYYQGRLIPINQVHVGQGQECGQREHWHASGNVQALDNTFLRDPNPSGCGFGAVSDVPVVDVYVEGDRVI